MTTRQPETHGASRGETEVECELSRIPFETTAQAELREGFIGQERALRALKMGELRRPVTTFLCAV